jgi:hypothetical protein
MSFLSTSNENHDNKRFFTINIIGIPFLNVLYVTKNLKSQIRKEIHIDIKICVLFYDSLHCLATFPTRSHYWMWPLNHEIKIKTLFFKTLKKKSSGQV